MHKEKEIRSIKGSPFQPSYNVTIFDDNSVYIRINAQPSFNSFDIMKYVEDKSKSTSIYDSINKKNVKQLFNIMNNNPFQTSEEHKEKLISEILQP